jgi:hypothetical protein
LTLWTNRNSGSSKCLGYVATFQGTFDYEYSTATGTVGDATASDPLAQVAHSTQTNNSNITSPPPATRSASSSEPGG